MGVEDEPAELLSGALLTWVLRMLVRLGGDKKLLSDFFDFQIEPLHRALGLLPDSDGADQKVDAIAVRKQLAKMLKDAEQASDALRLPAELQVNLQRLADLVGLCDVEVEILALAVILRNERVLEIAAETLGDLTSSKAIQAVAIIIGADEQAVRQALSMTGTLERSGLLKLDRGGKHELQNKLELISDNFADYIYSGQADPVQLLRDTVTQSDPPRLNIEHYEHVANRIKVIQHYFAESIKTQRKGVNVFIYGLPGTGKTELAKVLAKELGCTLYQIASEDSDGDPIKAERRLRAYRAAQCFFNEQNALLLFDEVEDVFNDGNNIWGAKSTAQKHKAWMNRTLEENPVPALWLSNTCDGLDPAFIRRFDMVVELPIPPRKQRERLLGELGGELLDAKTIAKIAQAEDLSPAVVSKVTSVVGSIREHLSESERKDTLEMMLNDILQAQGGKSLRNSDALALPDLYDPAFINTDTDLLAMSSGIKAAKSARLCLYGPSGTGKTAYGRWLAEYLETTLIVKKVSDLQSKWIGECEKNIAKAFKQAENEGAVLLIDEVDSFLQDRRGASRSWEVSQVNEMLTQMESFSGVFIASTNLMTGLDQAALRRFDLKLKFDYLRAEQARELFLRHCDQFQFERNEDLASGLCRAKTLTPGDFAAVLRQHRFRPVLSASGLVDALLAETAVKEEKKNPIGFCV